MNTELFLSLFTAAGLGSVFTVLVQSWLQSRKEKNARIFQERKEAYLGLLRALHDAAVKPSDMASKEFAYWQLRCELIAEVEVRLAIQRVVDTNELPANRAVAYDDLKRILRADLGVAE